MRLRIFRMGWHRQFRESKTALSIILSEVCGFTSITKLSLHKYEEPASTQGLLNVSGVYYSIQCI